MSVLDARPAHELQVADFQACPAWRFITPGEASDPEADESFVVAQRDPPGTGQFASFLVAAQYELEDGSRHPGIVQVDILDTQIEFVPVTIFAKGKAVDPLGRDAAARLQRILQATSAQPIRWCLDVLLAGEAQPRCKAIAKPGLAQAATLLAQLARLKLRGRT